MSNRILDYPEATEITSNDYILLDNEGTGAKCIKASALNINMDNYTIKEARGAIASFEDGEDLPLAFMGAYIEPVQDLHGYDHPWVGGSGKNKIPMTVDGIKGANPSATWNGNSTTINGVTFSIQTDGDGNVIGLNANGVASGDSPSLYLARNVALADGSYVLNGCPNNGSLQSYGIFADYSSGGNIPDYGSGATLNISNVTLNIRIRISNGYTANNLTFKPMIRLASVTDATFEPYSNICPISGWSEANVSVSGVNVWDEEWEVGGLVSGCLNSKNFIPVIPSTTYFFAVLSNKYPDIYWYDENKTLISFTPSVYNHTFDTPSNCHFIKFRMANAYGTTYNNDISINYPSTDTEYHAYNGYTYTIDLNGTRYGGKLDVVSGVLTVDRAYVDLGTLDWQYSSISERFYVGASDLGVKGTDASTPFNAISSALIAKSYNEIDAKTVDYAIGINPNATQLFARYSSITSASDFITAMNGVQLVYELATPLTYQLSKQQIKSLVGENNIFADTGDSIVDYRKLWVMPEM